MTNLRSAFLFTCCLFVAIGPLNVMQMIAWGNMLHDYSRERTIVEAAEMTFSGDYPCEMCRKIAEAKMMEQQRDDPAPHPAEERAHLRLVFHHSQNKHSSDFNWLSSARFQSGDLLLTPPATRCDRVPTPPPQPRSC